MTTETHLRALSGLDAHHSSPLAFIGRETMGGDVADDFGIEEADEGGVPVLAVSGEIDLSRAPELRERLVAIAASGAKLAVVDLTDVTFLDSTALGVLVSGLKRMRAAGGDLRLVMTRPNLMKVFEITGLLDLFPMSSSRAEAVA